MACQCDYSYTCPECQARIDIELVKYEAEQQAQELSDNIKNILERLDRIEKKLGAQ